MQDQAEQGTAKKQPTTKQAFIGLGSLVVLAGIYGALTSESGWKHVTAKQFGSAWPLTVSSGDIYIDQDAASLYGGEPVVFRADDGTVYALSATARDINAQHHQWHDLDEIWSYMPGITANTKGLKPRVNIGPLLDIANGMADKAASTN